MEWVAFLLAALGFAYLPGPAMLYTAAQTLGRGRRAGWLAVTGVHLGCYVHVVAAAFGLALLFAAIPPAYLAMKVIGGIYLLWMGVRLWQQGIRTNAEELPLATTRRVLRDSFLVEVLNPKTALFFVAFLPQFVQPDSAMPVAWQLLWLGIATNVLFSSADVVVVLLASPLRACLQTSHGSSKLIQRMGGGVLMGLGGNTLVQAAR
ncbi:MULTISPECIES: LysE family translocator [Halomonadaceae]|jgi:threonine/homoserine/homoserine lactone efflux protein|uniref:LysE family translocator n=1 Tax=Vreelandella piezotolerans TaxID=2609667 RepID=A0ABQ6XD51_9GAMM|nr:MULTISPECIES: LysE family translocator [Halomonas]KAE8439943.1 LysE family translocator [Halomonas piezotolerans]MCG7576637.1 LysE family translocator [Halomonas sp. MMH1-48]MCG7589428.1 LysE family translocator [Halomonas sp. McD50-5]MCG7603700.1 LysE family translocator [Halomonas sp. MM17-34]MCG7612828.1 LysE family translocator [Halomonas sp. MM17-29]